MGRAANRWAAYGYLAYYMEKYRIHFGVSQGKDIALKKAIDTAILADEFGIRTRTGGIRTTIATTPEEEILNGWYIATFTEEQIDLLAYYFFLARDLQQPTLFGVSLSTLHEYFLEEVSDNAISDIKLRLAINEITRSKAPMYTSVKDFFESRFLFPVQRDIAKSLKILYDWGYIDTPIYSQSSYSQLARKTPRNYFSLLGNLKILIQEKRYGEFIQKYYEMLGKAYYGSLHSELIYIKRLAKIPFLGRDLLYFRRGKSRTELINSNLAEYCNCINHVLEKRQEMGLQAPLDALVEYSPTLDQIIEQKKHFYVSGVFIFNPRPPKESLSQEFFRYSPYTVKGNLIVYYVDQVKSCKIIENVTDKSFLRVWTTYSPTSYQRDVLDQGLELHGVEVYRHKKWRQSKREPDFTTLTSLIYTKKLDCITDGIHYTGRHHVINGQDFFEVDLLRNNPEQATVLGNPFRELVGEILRDAENILRENHGIPRISEGWVSEMELFNLVKSIFPDAVHHASPDWLTPQHLDVFVESQKLAFEYQGRQHYEPIDYFGGEEAFHETQKRDERKKSKCQANRIKLICWMYTEKITKQALLEKLSSANQKH